MVTSFGAREIICSYSNHSRLALRYPRRHVSSDMHAEDDRFYYYVPRLKGFRTVMLKDWSVWTSVRDSDGWPSGLIRKVWPRGRAP